MLFCPTCGNLLMIEPGPTGGMRFCCQTCPYVQPLGPQGKVSKKVPVLKSKEVDDILGGDSAWENVDRTEARCPHCGGNEAYFFMAQLRSADEPMTTFYRCTKCRQRWNE